ncbi:hypothetical protein EAG_10039 [Camponotus floridanus]|uniref:Uncharacterized protein n=1 Tax=Camponotus floridanus TaxID=104421 RepID=E2AV56_CAMFO|nr:hypothetical protein EAG_10039 [Camponotus floridanus]
MVVVVGAVPAAIPPRRGLTNVEPPFEIHPSESETRVVGWSRGGAGGGGEFPPGGGMGYRELLPGCVGVVGLRGRISVLVRRNRREAWKHTSEY